MKFLGRLLAGIVVAAVGALAVAVTVKTVKSILDRNRLANLAHSDGMRSALVETIQHCDNKVTLKDLNSNKRVTYQGEGIGRDVREGIII